jgi:truncated hemoglobin YjbI
VPQSFQNELKQFRGKLAVLFFSIFFERMGHANALLLDLRKDPPVVERFEPHGGYETLYNMPQQSGPPFSKVAIDEAIRKSLKKHIGAHTYLSPQDVCPYLGPQRKQEPTTYELGFCQTWVGLYLDARLRNPDLGPDEVITSLLSYSGQQLRDMVQSFSRTIDSAFPATSHAQIMLDAIRPVAERFRPEFPKFANLLMRMAKSWAEREHSANLAALLDIATSISRDLEDIGRALDAEQRGHLDDQLTVYLRENPADRKPEEALARLANPQRYPLIAKYFQEPLGQPSRWVERLLRVYDALGADDAIDSLMEEFYTETEGGGDVAALTNRLMNRAFSLGHVERILFRVDPSVVQTLLPRLRHFATAAQHGLLSREDNDEMLELLITHT